MTTPFPAGTVEHRAELAFGAEPAGDPTTWTWTDVTGSLRAQQITITHGEQNEGSSPTPGTMSVELDNPDGDFTPDYPLGAHYPDVILGVPFRYSLRAQTTRLVLDGTDGSQVSTPDDPVLDITGDIDLRFEGEIDWYAAGAQILLSKALDAGDQRSYRMLVQDGFLFIVWSTDGTSGGGLFVAELLPQLPRRAAVRATLDVDNGAGGWTVRFYHAVSLDGPWTQFFTFSGSGVTSIFDSTSALEIPPFLVPTGSVYRMEVRDGIDGTVVANPDFTVLSDGTTGFTDAAGRVWTVTAPAVVTNWVIPFVGNVDSWAPTWPYGDLSDSKQNGEARVSLVVSGALRRLRQNSQELESTLRRRLPTFGPLAYWPMEDGEDASAAASALSGGSPMQVIGFTFAQDATLAGSKPLPAVAAGGRMTGQVPVQESPVSWMVEMIYMVSSAPGSDQKFLEFRTTGTIRRWRVLQRDGVATVQGLDFESILQVNSSFAIGADVFEGWNRLQLRCVQEDFDTVRWTVTWFNIGGQAGQGSDTTSAVIGYVTQIDTTFGTIPDLRVGHVSVFPDGTDAFSALPYQDADTGFNGERAGDRLIRLAAEEDLPLLLRGFASDTEQMGPQLPGDFIKLIEECALADGGILGEQRDGFGLEYRTRTNLYSQDPLWELDAQVEQVANPFQPVLDDQRVRNDSTVTRVGGSSARAVDDASVARVGSRPEQVTFNLFEDAQTGPVAQWRVHLGTTQGMRYSSVTTELALAPDQIDGWLGLIQGDKITVAGLPPQHSPEPVELLVRGFRDQITPTRWITTAVCSPAAPWTVGVLDDPVLGKADTAGTDLGAGIDTDDTSLNLVTTSGPRWIDSTGYPDEFPFELAIGGERVSVMAITGTASPQTATVVRSVNGIVKSHAAGAAVRLAQPMIVAL